MRKSWMLLILFYCLTLGSSQAKMEFPIPMSPPRLVNDYTQLLTNAEQQLFEKQLLAFSDSTGIQIAIVVVNSIGEYEISEYATALLREWGIGSKKNNSGVLFLIVPEAHKLFIATGYGIEGALPDGKLQLIINKEIKPEFKEGNYFTGIQNGINSVIALSKGEYKEKTNRTQKSKKFPFAFLLLIIMMILVYLFRNRGGGTTINRGGFSDIASGLFLASMLNNGRGNSGGSWGGGDSGGFGGFGGGSGGGGGAGGSW